MSSIIVFVIGRGIRFTDGVGMSLAEIGWPARPYAAPPCHSCWNTFVPWACRRSAISS